MEFHENPSSGSEDENGHTERQRYTHTLTENRDLIRLLSFLEKGK
jgi:hypothetical protein